jgi:hypothetical protein
VDVFRKCEADPLVICTVAWLYWADRRIESTHKCFERAVSTVSVGLEFGDRLDEVTVKRVTAKTCRRAVANTKG